jgi:hypothetical protein
MPVDYTDKTTPKAARRGGRRDAQSGPTYGWFVDYGDRVVLVDRRGNVYNPEWVSIQHGGWGFDGEGFAKLPRPRKIDMTTGEKVIDGDRVLIFFLEGDPRLVVVTAGFRSVKADDWLPYNHQSTGANPNALRARVQPLNSTGQVTGRVDIKIADDDKGTAYLGATDGFTVAVGQDLDNPDVLITATSDRLLVDVGGIQLQVDKGLVRLGDSEATDPVVLASLALARINNLENAYNAHTHAVAGATSPPVPLTPGTFAGATTSLVSPVVPTVLADLSATKVTGK